MIDKNESWGDAARQQAPSTSRAAKMPTTSREAHVAHNLTVFEPFLGRPLSASLAAVPAVIAGHRCTCRPFRAQLQRSTDSECITRDLPENVPCSYFVPNSINTVYSSTVVPTAVPIPTGTCTSLQPVLQHGRINCHMNVQMLTPPHWL